MIHKINELTLGLLIVSLFIFSFTKSFAASINGLWQSEGYSMIRDINDTTVKRYELSKVSCILAETISISKFNQEFSPIIFSDNGQEMTLHENFLQNKFEYQRINTLPSSCQNGGTAASTDAILSFDILWHTFNENYAFFDLRGVDWDAQYAIYRPQVNHRTSELELFTIFKSMLDPLGDGHVTVSTASGLFYSAEDNITLDFIQRIINEYIILQPNMSLEEYYFQKIKRFKSIIADHYLAGNSKSDASKLITWGKINNRIGYLSIDQMDGFSETDDPIQDLQIIAHTMELVMSDLQNMDAMVIDVRMNGGGYDDIGYKVVSRFISGARSVLIKTAVSQQGFSDKNIIKITPEGQTAFTKPVFILFSENSASATEVFLLSMKNFPNVTLIGEHSMGIFSDMLDRRLANSMNFTLSNEVYTDMDGVVYEKTGIQADIAIDFLLKFDLDKGIDSAIEKAISLTP